MTYSTAAIQIGHLQILLASLQADIALYERLGKQTPDPIIFWKKTTEQRIKALQESGQSNEH